MVLLAEKSYFIHIFVKAFTLRSVINFKEYNQPPCGPVLFVTLNIVSGSAPDFTSILDGGKK